MQAVEVTIHNFRSIIDANVRLATCGLLVGANNSGKSTVVDSIRAFYEKGLKFDFNRDFPKGNFKDDSSWVEIEFKPSIDELQNLKDEYKTARETFRVRKYFKTSETGADGKVKSGAYVYINDELSDERFYAVKNITSDKFGELIYVPAVSRVDEHTKLTGPSALRDLVSTILSRVIDESEAYQKLKSAFGEFEKSIKSAKTEEGYSLEAIEDDISSQISQWGTEFRLSVNAVGIDEMVKNLISHEIYDRALKDTQSPAVYGQGFQRSLIYALIRMAANIQHQLKSQLGKSFLQSLHGYFLKSQKHFYIQHRLEHLVQI